MMSALQAASQLLRMLTKEEPAHKLVDLRELLAPPSVSMDSWPMPCSGGPEGATCTALG
jgi:hypothetical protein